MTPSTLRSCLWVCALTALACTTVEPPPAPDPRAPTPYLPVTLSDHLASCGLLGSFAVQSVNPPGACSFTAAPQQAVEISAVDDDTGRVRVGTLLLAISAREGCVFHASGCQGTTPEALYLSVEASMSMASGVLSMDIRPLLIAGHKRDPCAVPHVVKAKKQAASTCNPVGAWQMTGPAGRTKGKCGFSWPDVRLTITKAGAGYAVDWPGQSLAFVSFSPLECQLTLGPAGQFHHGVTRKVTVRLSFRGDVASGTISDVASAPTDLGETCDAEFAFTASRAGLTALKATCDVPRPYACGDGSCEAARGETCAECPQDCGCKSEEGCVSMPGQVGGECASKCVVKTDECKGATQCIRQKTAIGGESISVCLPAGAKTEGAACEDDIECAKGLGCLKLDKSQHGWPAEARRCLKRCFSGVPNQCSKCLFDDGAEIGVCSQPCDIGQPDGCGPDMYCWRPYTNKPPRCYPNSSMAAGLGEPCAGNTAQRPGCKGAMFCVLSNPNNYCTKTCSGNDDCPKPFTYCGSLTSGKSACLK